MQASKIDFLNIDCMDYMSGLEDNAFDLAIVDPPYGLDKSSMQGAGKLKNRILNRSNTDWDIAPQESYFKDLRRVSQNQIIWGGNYFVLPPSRCFLIWDKKQFMPTFSACELAWTSFNKPAKIYCLARNGGSRTLAALTDIIHPTQKPVRLYDWLLWNYAKPGQRILDTHLGSGSSAIAAHYFGCDFVGCEIDRDYFEAAQKRFEKETRQLVLNYG
jgi:site-specific DNA-methyltransferase (adenine-specific)